ncbi:MAG TPA: hypothetical protein VN814_08775 [Caulobacteraceae bacterium]|nr:hypothetical protein [Caulobacteraceae bacterium]
MIWIRRLIRWLAKHKAAAKKAIQEAERELAEHLKDAEYWGKKAFKEGNPEVKEAYKKLEQDYLRKAAEAEKKLHELKTVSAKFDADADVFVGQLAELDRVLSTADLLVSSISLDDAGEDEPPASADAGSSRGAEKRLKATLGG